MTHAQVEPGLQCPGVLHPDRYRHRRGSATRAWRCSCCRQRFITIDAVITPGFAVTPETQARLIREARP